MEKKIEEELIENLAFRMGKMCDKEEFINSYREASEETECFCF